MNWWRFFRWIFIFIIFIKNWNNGKMFEAALKNEKKKKIRERGKGWFE